MTDWTADITNDPDQDFDLYVELMYGDTYVARIENTAEGLRLRHYGVEAPPIPLPWLFEVVKWFEGKSHPKEGMSSHGK